LKKIKSVANQEGVNVVTIHDRIERGLYKKVTIDGMSFIDISASKSQYSLCVEMWYAFYKKRFEVNPVFNGMNGKKMKEIIAYFDANFKENTPSECFGAILTNWDSLPKFIREKYSLAILLQNLNEVIATLKKNKGHENIDFTKF
jgi:hypothetical protein